MVSRFGKAQTAYRIVVAVRICIAKTAIRALAVIALCMRYGGPALARANGPTVWHATRLCIAGPCLGCPRLARARESSPGGAQRRARRAAPYAPQCCHRRRAPSRVRPPRGPGARGGADGLPPI